VLANWTVIATNSECVSGDLRTHAKVPRGGRKGNTARCETTTVCRVGTHGGLNSLQQDNFDRVHQLRDCYTESITFFFHLEIVPILDCYVVSDGVIESWRIVLLARGEARRIKYRNGIGIRWKAGRNHTGVVGRHGAGSRTSAVTRAGFSCCDRTWH
jgi:hypothetical protein